MTRKETGIIMDILATAYPRFYSGPDAPDPAKAVSLWAEMFAEDDVALVAAAVKALIATAQSDPAFAARVDESATRVLNLKKSLQS